MNHTVTAASIRRDVARMIRPAVRMSVSDASKKYVKVKTPSGGIETWDETETPYMIEPMNCLSRREYGTVVFMGPARTGKTQALIDNWVAYMIKCEPCLMKIVHMTEATANRYSRQRIDLLHRYSAELKKEIEPGASNDNTYNKYYKSGNSLGIAWPSITNFSGDDIKFFALTDYDRFPTDIGGEGTGYFLANKRTQTFGTRGMTLVESSPGFEVMDPKWSPHPNALHEAPPADGIAALFNMGDRRRFYWKCPHCNDYFMPPPDHRAFSFIHNVDLLGMTDAQIFQDVGFVCTKNGCFIEQSHKRLMNETGIWVPEGCHIENGVLVGDRKKTRIASFWLPGAAAAFQDPNSIIEKYLNALRIYETTGVEIALKSVVMTDFGCNYSPIRHQSDIGAHDLERRAEDLPRRMVCVGVLFLIAAIDVQSWGWVVQVVGYGKQFERWIIDRFDINISNRKNDGNPVPTLPHVYLEDWDLITEKVLRLKYPLADGSGREMDILRVMCDSGGREGVTPRAYDYWRKTRRLKLHKKFNLLKGKRPNPDQVYAKIKKSYPDNTNKNKKAANARGEIPLWILNSTQMKDAISSDLSRTEKGMGYIHFPDWLKFSFYEELTVEVRTDKGWENPLNKRNESFDLLHYADAGYQSKMVDDNIVDINWDDPPWWAKPWDENRLVSSAQDIQSIGITDPINASKKTSKRRIIKAKDQFN